MLQAVARDHHHAPSALSLLAAPEVLAAANVNPATGLSTDYLNHFNEAIMLLEMLPALPECQEDFAAWTPLDYRAHFERSRLAQGELAIAAYEAAEPHVRAGFDAICRAMRDEVLAAQGALEEGLGEDDVTRLAEATTLHLKELAARAGAIIHGHDPVAESSSIQESQAAIDALLEP